MKFLVLSALVAATAGQGFFGLQAGPDGTVTPIDEPAVAAARADHLATKFGGVAAAAGYYPYAADYTYAGYPYAAGLNGWAPAAAAPYYAGPVHIPRLVVHPNGAVVPADEPAVVAARAEHLAALQGAAAIAAAVPVSAPVAPLLAAAAPAVYAPAYAGPLHYPQLVAHPNGAVVPADEPAVVAARAEHLAAKQGAALAAGAPVAPLVAAAALAVYAPAYAGPIHYPQLVAHPNGAVVPADEPAVVAARAEHLAAHGAVYGGVYASAPAAPAVYASGYYGLVAHPNGAVVPVDEPAVAAARAQHLAAHGK